MRVIHAKHENGNTTITIQTDTSHDFYTAVTEWTPDAVCIICHKTNREHSEEEFGTCWSQVCAELAKRRNENPD